MARVGDPGCLSHSELDSAAHLGQVWGLVPLLRRLILVLLLSRFYPGDALQLLGALLCLLLPPNLLTIYSQHLKRIIPKSLSPPSQIYSLVVKSSAISSALRQRGQAAPHNSPLTEPHDHTWG
jgi:hypothetical protein